ncbi:hypothetical protein Daesc_007619 [Daldinia eschscholtzii]|uniref:Pentatricopeptide repeat-containing protein n=1 Tax=Daldinia eschscholtzii TaxID=292717 RepID=A0AAX6MEN3_9PEZI
MSTPFVCRQCTTRSSQFHSVRIRPRPSEPRAPAVLSIAALPIWSVPAEQQREISTGYGFAGNQGTKSPTYNSGLQDFQYDSVIEDQPRWNGQLVKFTNWRRPEVKKLGKLQVLGSQDLKKKILRCLGDYRIVHDDLIRFYSLSPQEARHAISQLERLLGGREAAEAGARLEQFHLWKSHFKELSEIVSGSHPTPGNDDDSPEHPLWTYSVRHDSEAMKEVWQRQDQTRRQYLWPQTIVSTFRSHLSTIPNLIRATFQPSWCPSYIVEDVVYLLSRTLDNAQASKNDQWQLIELVFFLLKNSTPRFMILEQRVIWKVMSLIPTSRVAEFHERLKNIEHPLNQNTLLHFASRFARSSNHKVQAAEILHSLSGVPGFDINSPVSISVCTSLLSVEEGKLPGNHAAPDELFKMLLDAGFQPNILTLSTLMRNFCVRGRVEVALDIFDLLAHRNIQPDAHIFSILINGAKHALDIESLQRIVNMIDARKAWFLYLVNDLLEFIYQYNESQRGHRRRQRKTDTARAWRLMVQVYLKFFKPDPLQKLTLFPLENLLATRQQQVSPKLQGIDRFTASLKPLPNALLLQPDSITLGLMFRVHFWTIQNPVPLQMYYKHFMEKLREGDPIITQIVKDQGTMVFDTFLRDFMQFKSTLKKGLLMVQGMHDRANQEKEKLGKNILHPQPSVHTYTILITALRNHHHTQGVIVTLIMMIKEGIEPNIITWNAVIGALLQKGYLEEAVRVLQNLKQVGLESNARTVQEITKVSKHKRRHILKLMSEDRVYTSDQLSFARSLLRRWEKGDNRLIDHRHKSKSRKTAANKLPKLTQLSGIV